MAIPVLHASNPASLVFLREFQREASFHVVGLVSANDGIAFFVDGAVISDDPQNVWLLILFILKMEAT